MAEALGPHLNKGLLVGVQGKLKIDDYEDKEGVKRTSVCVMADDISLGPKNGDGASKSKSSESSDESVPF